MLDIFFITSYQKPVNGRCVGPSAWKIEMTSYGQWARPLTTDLPPKKLMRLVNLDVVTQPKQNVFSCFFLKRFRGDSLRLV